MRNRVVVTPESPRVAEHGLVGLSLVDFWLVAITERRLLRALVRRDIGFRYRGSVLGLGWLVGVPLVMTLAYAFVFTVVLKVNWSGQGWGKAQSALALYVGIIAYTLFSESVSRAATLIADNSALVKKTVFPLKLLSWMTLITSWVGAGVSLAILVIIRIVVVGYPDWRVVFLLVSFGQISLLALGASWVLAAAGAFFRDVRHIAGPMTTLLMFLSPVFYPTASVPESVRPLIELNPFSVPLEMARAALLGGPIPSFSQCLISFGVSLATTCVGYSVFRRAQKGFADVV